MDLGVTENWLASGAQKHSGIHSLKVGQPMSRAIRGGSFDNADIISVCTFDLEHSALQEVSLRCFFVHQKLRTWLDGLRWNQDFTPLRQQFLDPSSIRVEN